jgi:hypothetical protein
MVVPCLVALVVLACSAVAACTSNTTDNAPFACGDSGDTICKANQYCVIYQATSFCLDDAGPCPAPAPFCSQDGGWDPSPESCSPPKGRFVYCITCY